MDIREINGLWCDDITFCQEKCDMRDCPRNQCNIRDHNIPHSFSVERPKDCPKEKVMPDREKVIKGLRNLRDAIATDYIHEADQAIGTIDNALALLKEQETPRLRLFNEREYVVRYTGDALQLLPDIMQELVRCKDCVSGDPYLKPDKYGRYGVCELHNHIIKSADWFCADGEPKGGDGDA